MGSDARVYIFDDGIFQDVVVPAFHKLLLDSSVAPWLKKVQDELNQEGFDIATHVFGGVDFKKNCRYLKPDFAYSGSEKDQWTSRWQTRACSLIDCPDEKHCPLHRSNASTLAEDLAILFERAVSSQCLGRSQFVGRSMSPMKYSVSLFDPDCKVDPKLDKFLKLLAYRGFVIGYQFCNSDGIHGWLSAEETRQFANILPPLQLPPFEKSFEAMENFRTKSNTGPAYELPQGYSFKHLSFAFLRTVGVLASEQGKGILWGNDLSIP